MALLLNIDSAFEQCTVTISNNEEVIAHEQSLVQKDHASFLQPAILKICKGTGIDISDIDAISVANGPGSYTGLRVSLSSAKGICYTLQKPLILLNTLDILAFALQQEFNPGNNTLICPIIDARRMEVFTAFYDNNLKIVKDYASVILNEQFLVSEKTNYAIIAGGNGSFKLKQLPLLEDIIYGTSMYNKQHFALLAYKAFTEKKFADLAYSEPFYIKPAYIR